MNCDNCGKTLDQYKGHYIIQCKEKGWFKPFTVIGHLCWKCVVIVDMERFINDRRKR